MFTKYVWGDIYTCLPNIYGGIFIHVYLICMGGYLYMFTKYVWGDIYTCLSNMYGGIFIHVYQICMGIFIHV